MIRSRTRLALVALLLLVTPLVARESIEAPAASAPTIALSAERNPLRLTAEALGAARHSVRAVVYKFDEAGMLESIARAVDRGVEVRLLVDGEQASKKKSLVSSAAAAGAAVRVWPGSHGKLHAKFTLIDEAQALTGSFNWTRSARGDNVELVMTFEDAATLRRLAELFERLWVDAAAAVAGPD